jgi:hypothetical protein
VEELTEWPHFFVLFRLAGRSRMVLSSSLPPHGGSYVRARAREAPSGNAWLVVHVASRIECLFFIYFC